MMYFLRTVVGAFGLYCVEQVLCRVHDRFYIWPADLILYCAFGIVDEMNTPRPNMRKRIRMTTIIPRVICEKEDAIHQLQHMHRMNNVCSSRGCSSPHLKQLCNHQIYTSSNSRG